MPRHENSVGDGTNGKSRWCRFNPSHYVRCFQHCCFLSWNFPSTKVFSPSPNVCGAILITVNWNMGALSKGIYNCGLAKRRKMSTAMYRNPVLREHHHTNGNTEPAKRLCWRVPMFLLTMTKVACYSCMHSNPQHNRHCWMYNTMCVLFPCFSFVQIVFHLVSLAWVSSLVCAAFPERLFFSILVSHLTVVWGRVVIW